MQDMDEMAVRAALRHVVSADEPPVGALVGEALRAGLRLRRRRRLQAAGGCLAVVAVLAAGVPAVATALGSAPVTAPTGAAEGGPGPRVHVALPPGFHMVPPVVSAQIPAGHQVPATAKSVASLLLAVLPAGQRASHMALAAAAPRNISAVASVDVATLRTTGSVTVQLGRPGGARLLSCATARTADGSIIACRDYSVPGGTEVQELVLAAGVGSGNGVADGFSYVFAATVRRADGVSVMVQASNYVPGPASLPPLTMAQVVTAAADPRWSWTMDSTFVAQAAKLRLRASAPPMCAQVHPADPNC